MVGILVHGDNHFIVRGPLPDRATALALVRHWSIIQIATLQASATLQCSAIMPPALDRWCMTTKEFRENLTWAVIVPEIASPPRMSRNCWPNSPRGESPYTIRTRWNAPGSTCTRYS